MNKPKAAARSDGKSFLRSALQAEQQILAAQLKLSSQSITHSGVMGEVNEQHFIDVLRKYLPMRYAVDHAIVIDSNGATSDQIDIVIFDHQYTPTLLDQQCHRYVPAEAVYCVMEVKPVVNKANLEYAADKAASVRRLERTSIPIQHAGGEHPPKALFPIVSAIVAPEVEWGEGLLSNVFSEHWNALQGDLTLDCCLALADRSIDRFDDAPAISPAGSSLAFFLFRLLRRLQALGTVPAVDWNRYGLVLAVENN